jgi:hypothetical protein
MPKRRSHEGNWRRGLENGAADWSLSCGGPEAVGDQVAITGRPDCG